ncbi:MAG TPA: porin, partial [Pseudomonadales bacterium]|nr:porin [Pseudomonadales bacterium]
TEGKNYLALAYDNEISTAWGNTYEFAVPTAVIDPTVSSGTPFMGSAVKMDTWRLVGQFGVDALTLGALFETSKSSDDVNNEELKGSGFMLNAAYKMDTRNSLKIQIAQTKTEWDQWENKIQEIALGWDNKLSDTSKLYALLAENKSEISDDNGSGEGKQMNLAVGIQHNF